jgi:hypothetical protein
MNSEILNRKDSLNFILAGNSTVTFVNSKTNNRFTFKIRKSKDSELYFVSLLNSPDNYVYIGIIIPDGFRHSKKSSISEKSQSVQVFKYVYNKLIKDTLEDFIQIWHEGKCGKCGRKLTVPNSISTGIGPECMKNIHKETKRNIILESIFS